jgi:2,4-dienoyl-CoA reductase-like NADH-dependent reductase (Old Yellow Enzyme family)
MAATPKLFEPLSLRDVTLRNRVVVAPMCQYYATEGIPDAWHRGHHARFALGGVGMVIAEATGVTRDGRISPGCTGLWNDAQVAAWREITSFHRAHGVVSAIQLNHAGAKGATERPWDGNGALAADGPEPFWETIGPSAIPMRQGWRAPREATVAELDEVVQAFAAAAARAVRAGFDAIELHGAHGYLLHAFLSPISNRRTDSYGGDAAGRMRLSLRVAEAVRAAIPPGMPLLWRSSLQDNAPDGLTLADTLPLVRELKPRGVDMVDCSAGGIGAPVSLMVNRQEHGFQVPLAEAVKRDCGMPSMAVGLITEPVLAEAILAEGRADCVALAREMIADPNWAYRAARELGLAAPASVLPRSYAFYLDRRAAAQGRH